MSWRAPFQRIGCVGHTAAHCNTLQHTAIHCNTLQHTAIHCNTLQHSSPVVDGLCWALAFILNSHVVQFTATHCNTLQHICHTRTLSCIPSNRNAQFSGGGWAATNTSVNSQFSCNTLHCNTLQHTATHCNTLQHTATHCNTLQHTVTHCDTLEHTATHCNTLQHTACNTLQHSSPVVDGLRPALISILSSHVVQLLDRCLGDDFDAATARGGGGGGGGVGRGRGSSWVGRVEGHVAASGEFALLLSCMWSKMRLEGLEVCCSVLQCVAVCCSVLQCVAMCCNVFQMRPEECCSVLRFVAMYL